ncbi:hypothetical protein C2G38_2105592, partial [Gigaspora rosea]
LINFKWNVYGRFYYFILWVLYSIFMCCFLIVSTIPSHKISWNNQAILLTATIIFGFIRFIFEVRQFIHKPIAYIASPWNWFDSFGIYFAIMIGVAQKVFSFLIVLGIMVLAFAHSLHLLLRPTSDSSSVSSWALKNNWTLAFLLVIFSFFTTIY